MSSLIVKHPAALGIHEPSRESIHGGVGKIQISSLGAPPVDPYAGHLYCERIPFKGPERVLAVMPSDIEPQQKLSSNFLEIIPPVNHDNLIPLCLKERRQGFADGVIVME